MENKNNQTQSIWSVFTKKYSLQKTLRFELKPVGETKKWLEENDIFKKDLNIDKSYNQAKFYFDKLHQDFIKESLSVENGIRNIDFEKFAKIFESNKEKIVSLKKKNKEVKDKNKKNWDEISKLEKEIEGQRENLYKEIRELFDKRAEKWKKEYQDKEIERGGKKEKIKFSSADLKQKGVNFLTAAGIINILKYKFPAEKDEEFRKEGYPSLFINDELNPGKKIYIFESFDKFTTYLSKFQQTRENLYKDDGTSTAVATRIVSNFERFLENKSLFEEKYKNKAKDVGLTKEEEKVFEINYYYDCLIQEGIDKYNKIIGEINRKTKEYRDKNKIDKKDLPLFLNLEKQILGEVKKERVFIEAKDEKTEEEVFIDRFQEFIKRNKIKIYGDEKEEIEGAKKFIEDFTSGIFENDYQSIYLKKNVINEIVNKWFSNPEEFLMKLTGVKSEEKIKLKKFTSLDEFKNAILSLEGDIFKSRFYKNEVNPEAPLEKEEKSNNWENFLKIWRFEFESLFKDKVEKGEIKKDKNGEPIQIFWGYTDKLEKEAEKIKFYSAEKEQIKTIKNYCDAALRINRMMRYFNLSDKDRKDVPSGLSTEFYRLVDEYFNNFEFNKYYNGIRNFITKKPSDENKIKLNFESRSLLDGWDVSKEKDNLGLIFIKNNKYYLGVLRKENSKLFDYQITEKDNQKEKERKNNLKNEILANDNEDFYLKMNYWQIADPAKDIFNLVLMPDNTVKRFTKLEEKNKHWPDEIKRIKEKGTYKREKVNREDLVKIINYFRKCALIYWKKFDLKLLPSEEYQTFKDFTDHIALQGYKINFDKIKASYIEKQLNDGNLYLFEVSNKDFYKYKKPDSRKNIHTLYWEHIFSKENLEEIKYPLIRLNGKAEIFYRDVLEMNEEMRKPVILERLNGAKQAKREDKPVYHYQRYLKPTYLFHCPITLNADKPSSSFKNFSSKLNHFIKDNLGKINIIGIDRGEKNLLYYCVINQNQEILDYGSLNKINLNKVNNVNYFDKLVEREKQRQLERQSWEPVAKIKDLKQGYISYVVRKICDLIINHNAIVVLEDLSRRFKQIRNGISERTVYQQFEKALIDKLNYLIFKDNRDVFSPGGVLNGYQLAAPFTSFKDIEKAKQTGVLFYTSAEYTSQTDPLTGFRKNIYISNSASQEKIKELINKLKKFGWDDTEESYFIEYNQVDFAEKKKKPLSKDWTIWTKVPRVIRWKESKSSYWSYKKINLNEEFRDLLEKYGFEAQSNDILSNLKKRIAENDKLLVEKKEFDGRLKNFYERFIFLFNIVLQVRNTYSLSVEIDKTEKKLKKIDYGIDFFASPVKPFFTTFGLREIGIEKDGKVVKDNAREEIASENLAEFKDRLKEYKPEEKFDADGVGAYNIARKGLIILEKIKNNPNKPDLSISKEEWDKFVQR
ncbi:MAG: hypothetical protein KatS3mg098_058 [Candidatus Parcubacteria bacterium]|nr:MAG: hypothetical protein KatS3mg098_058 [Candidatus Parcubacteria bacterium]